MCKHEEVMRASYRKNLRTVYCIECYRPMKHSKKTGKYIDSRTKNPYDTVKWIRAMVERGCEVVKNV